MANTKLTNPDGEYDTIHTTTVVYYREDGRAIKTLTT